jgi:hypothetical protein
MLLALLPKKSARLAVETVKATCCITDEKDFPAHSPITNDGIVLNQSSPA